jgi:hypothetical protein
MNAMKACEQLVRRLEEVSAGADRAKRRSILRNLNRVGGAEKRKLRQMLGTMASGMSEALADIVQRLARLDAILRSLEPASPSNGGETARSVRPATTQGRVAGVQPPKARSAARRGSRKLRIWHRRIDSRLRADHRWGRSSLGRARTVPTATPLAGDRLAHQLATPQQLENRVICGPSPTLHAPLPVNFRRRRRPLSANERDHCLLPRQLRLAIPAATARARRRFSRFIWLTIRLEPQTQVPLAARALWGGDMQFPNRIPDAGQQLIDLREGGDMLLARHFQAPNLVG